MQQLFMPLRTAIVIAAMSQVPAANAGNDMAFRESALRWRCITFINEQQFDRIVRSFTAEGARATVLACHPGTSPDVWCSPTQRRSPRIWLR